MHWIAGCGIPGVTKDTRGEKMPTEDDQQNGRSRTEVATLGGGCFWCLEAVYEDLRGVQKVESGYSGGTIPNPTYHQVCTGTTGHAEVVQLTFDPTVISFRDILEVFFTIHDPTQVNRQGPDVGTQYRSAIFYLTPEQETAAKESRERAQEGLSRPIATEITQASTFWPAEEYHQRYFEKHGFVGCHVPEFK